jgi:hypothetical protein
MLTAFVGTPVEEREKSGKSQVKSTFLSCWTYKLISCFRFQASTLPSTQNCRASTHDRPTNRLKVIANNANKAEILRFRVPLQVNLELTSKLEPACKQASKREINLLITTANTIRSRGTIHILYYISQVVRIKPYPVDFSALSRLCFLNSFTLIPRPDAATPIIKKIRVRTNDPVKVGRARRSRSW